MQVSG
jgi:DNA-directed RNA polymerase beta subunit